MPCGISEQNFKPYPTKAGFFYPDTSYRTLLKISVLNACFKTPLKDTPDVAFLIAIKRRNFGLLQRCLETGV